MAQQQTQAEQLHELAAELGVIRIRDARDRGIHPEVVRRLHRQGVLVRTGRGLYVPADSDVSLHVGLAQAAQRAPGGVVCLLSALAFHEMGVQLPHQIWLMIDRRAHRPKVDYPPLRIVRASGASLTEGVEQHQVDGVRVTITGRAKTVADCFKYRNKIGLDVALEALREHRRTPHWNVEELWRYAEIDRVARVMRPYLELIA